MARELSQIASLDREFLLCSLRYRPGNKNVCVPYEYGETALKLDRI
jgi:hypothetical protein